MLLPLPRLPLACCGVGLPLPAPTSAPAAPTCLHNVYHEVIVGLTAPGDDARIVAHPDGTIRLGDAVCGGDTMATVSNADAIFVSDSSGGSMITEIDGSQASFAPGFTDDGFGSEISFNLALGADHRVSAVDGAGHAAAPVVRRPRPGAAR